MQSLQEKASEWSGVPTSDAFAIDQTNLYQKLGLQTFIDLSTNFYNRVYDDEEEWFRSIFANSKKEDAIQNQYEFFTQRMGGPPLYSQRRGHPFSNLILKYFMFSICLEFLSSCCKHCENFIDNSVLDSSKLTLLVCKCLLSPVSEIEVEVHSFLCACSDL
ncbi:hypothetical protein ACS0TY_012232 [Phlomoides rotata]